MTEPKIKCRQIDSEAHFFHHHIKLIPWEQYLGERRKRKIKTPGEARVPQLENHPTATSWPWGLTTWIQAIFEWVFDV